MHLVSRLRYLNRQSISILTVVMPKRNGNNTSFRLNGPIPRYLSRFWIVRPTPVSEVLLRIARESRVKLVNRPLPVGFIIINGRILLTDRNTKKSK